MNMENEKMKEMKEKYQCGYDTYEQAVAHVVGFNMMVDEPLTWWAARFAARRVTMEMSNWIHNTFDLTDEQKEELHSLMCHVGSD